MLRSIFSALLLGATLLGAQPAMAADAASQVVIEAVEKKYAAVQGMRADFTQTVHNEVFGDEVQTGKVVLMRPAKMRWMYQGGQEFISDGSTMWVYNAAEKQVLRYTDISMGANTANDLLQSLDRIEEHFNVEVLPTTDGTHSLALTPKNDAQTKKVQLLLDADYVLKQVAITDAFDQVTELAFANMQLNPKDVPDTTFSFTAPDGVTVVEGNAR